MRPRLGFSKEVEGQMGFGKYVVAVGVGSRAGTRAELLETHRWGPSI